MTLVHSPSQLGKGAQGHSPGVDVSDRHFPWCHCISAVLPPLGDQGLLSLLSPQYDALWNGSSSSLVSDNRNQATGQKL